MSRAPVTNKNCMRSKGQIGQSIEKDNDVSKVLYQQRKKRKKENFTNILSFLFLTLLRNIKT